MQQLKEKNAIIIGSRIRDLRLKKGGSLNSFVLQKGGLTPATWSRIENGKVDLKFSSIIIIAAMLDTTVSELTKDVDFDYTITDD